ncbi:hypothetical protein, partial [Polaromonas sp.]|uniref:hypothetical protein n=1 Tax=Polaromonas sp. TaxID=1869339 RepID=UPI002B9B66F9
AFTLQGSQVRNLHRPPELKPQVACDLGLFLWPALSGMPPIDQQKPAVQAWREQIEFAMK